jgi:hypothetical protein
MISFSCGFDKAIIKVVAARALLSINSCPFLLFKALFLSKKYTNNAAAIRLLPSVKEWFFTTK